MQKIDALIEQTKRKVGKKAKKKRKSEEGHDEEKQLEDLTLINIWTKLRALTDVLQLWS